MVTLKIPGDLQQQRLIPVSKLCVLKPWTAAHRGQRSGSIDGRGPFGAHGSNIPPSADDATAACRLATAARVFGFWSLRAEMARHSQEASVTVTWVLGSSDMPPATTSKPSTKRPLTGVGTNLYEVFPPHLPGKTETIKTKTLAKAHITQIPLWEFNVFINSPVLILTQHQTHLRFSYFE